MFSHQIICSQKEVEKKKARFNLKLRERNLSTQDIKNKQIPAW